jgi:Rho GDP-dissociation inhibitor
LLTPLPDQNDESLRKWKESLGLGTGKDISDPSDPRKCIILSLGLEVEGRPDIIIDLKAPGAVEALKKKPFTIKEGAQFRMKAQFKVQHEILAGLKYLQKVSRMGISNKMQEMMVSGYGETSVLVLTLCRARMVPVPRRSLSMRRSVSSTRPLVMMSLS